jgi:Flp pilus assembly protein protease CpaA
MLVTVLLCVAFAIVAIATYTDIRSREVPDWLNFAGIAAGFGVRLVWALQTNDWAQLGWGAMGFALFFAIGVLMYYTGQWGGGDSKLMMALGVLFGFDFTLYSVALAFLIWALFAGAAYGLVWSVVLALQHWKDFAARYAALSRKYVKAHVPVWAVLILGIAFAIASDDQLFRVLMLSVALAAPVLFYLMLCVKAVENCCMYKATPPAQLTEGDWIAKNVVIKGKYICGPKDLGVTKKTIQQLKKLNVKSVLVKEGIPFVPSFFIAFVLTVLLGSPLVWFF